MCGKESSCSEIEVTPEMILAGVQALKENWLELSDPDEFHGIVRIVYGAMEASRRGLRPSCLFTDTTA